MRRILAVSLLSSLALTAAAAPGTPASDASAPTARPVSTGVTSPRLVHSQPITIPADEVQSSVAAPTIELKLKLDETGTPTDIHVTRSLNQQADARIVSAVRQFRWSPAVLDNRTIPFDLNLIVNVQR